MPTLHFLGKVYPVITKVNFPNIEHINWGSGDLGFPITMSSKIHDSIVEVVCEVPRFEEEHLSTLLSRAYNLTEACTDLAAFGTGIALWIDLDTVVKPDGSRETIFKNDPSLGKLCTAFKMNITNQQEHQEFGNVLTIVLGEPALLGSLHDLAQLLLQFNISPVNCARVLDSLRKAIAPNSDKKAGWVMLRKVINADEHYMNWVSVLSTESRHGDRTTPLSAGIVMEIRTRTWNVMNRFLEYRKGGSLDLDPVKFPLLRHDPSFVFPKP